MDPDDGDDDEHRISVVCRYLGGTIVSLWFCVHATVASAMGDRQPSVRSGQSNDPVKASLSRRLVHRPFFDGTPNIESHPGIDTVYSYRRGLVAAALNTI